MAHSNNRKTVCFDLDGTLCTNTYGAYDQAQPFPWAIERVNALVRAGHRIVVFTARGTATGIDWEEVTREQLDRWGVRYDHLQLGKPSADVYVDDRAVHTTAWREGDAFAVPGFGPAAPAAEGEELPGVMGYQRTTVVRSGCTFAGRAFLVAETLADLRAAAGAAGMLCVPSHEALSEPLDHALEASGHNANTDLVWSVALAEPTEAAFLDRHAARTPGVTVTVRPLAQAAEGLSAMASRDQTGAVTVLATTDPGAPGAGWPLCLAPGGALQDALGGQLLALDPEGVLVSSGRDSPLSTFVCELAAEAGLTFIDRPLDAGALRAAQACLVASVPFGLVRLGALDGTPLAEDRTPGDALAARWTERVGVDVDARLAGAVTGRPVPGGS
jgi:hypothetical protein